MSEKKTESKKTASICSIKGMRSAVFKKAHDKAKEYELEGNILMPNDWKEMLSEAWVEVTDEIARTCNQSGVSEEKESEQEPAEEKKEEKLEQVEQDNELVDVSSEPISAEEKEKTE